MRYINKNFTTVLADENSGRRFLSTDSKRLLQDEDVTASETNVFEGNEAPYGANMASYPGAFKFTFS